MLPSIARALRIAARGVDRKPSDGQKEAGNYAKGHLTIHGLDVTIENPKGSKRSGVSKSGHKWECVLPSHYGYVKGSLGSDGDHVDVYIGPDHESNKVFVVDQVDAKTGAFDEHKCLLSYKDQASAVADYTKAFSDGKGKDRIGSVTEMPVAAFKAWVLHGDTKKPLGLKGYASGGAVGMANGGPALARVYSPSGVPFTVAAPYAAQFQAFLADLENSGYKLNANESGGYNPRNIAGTNTPSEHSFGRAIDLNWNDNPRGGSHPTIPPDLARSMATKYGMTWGGDWHNPDYMHFQVDPAHPWRPDEPVFSGSDPLSRPIASQGPENSSIALAQKYAPLASETPEPPMALGAASKGPSSNPVMHDLDFPDYKSNYPEFPVSSPHRSNGADWVEGPLGLMPKWSDGSTPLQGLADGGSPGAPYRANMLPLAWDEQGNMRFSYPQIVPDTWHAMQKLGNAAQLAFTGEDASPSDVMPTAQDVNLLSGLAMTGSGFGVHGAPLAAGVARAAETLGDYGQAAGRHYLYPNEFTAVRSIRPADEATQAALLDNARGGIFRAQVHGDAPYEGYEPANTNAVRASYEAAVEQRDYPEFPPLPSIRPARLHDDQGRLLGRFDSYKDAMTFADQQEKAGQEIGNWYIDNEPLRKLGKKDLRVIDGDLFSNAPDSAPLGILPMDAASRMARAKEMGFDPQKTFYHGSQSGDIHAFDLDRAQTGWRGKAIHVSDDPSQAALYGSEGRDFPGAIYPLHLRTCNPADYNNTVLPRDALTDAQFAKVKNEWGATVDKNGLRTSYVMDALGGNEAIDILKRLGYDSMRDGSHHAVFDPSDIRSKFAAFDPSQSDSANILAANRNAPLGLLDMGAARYLTAPDQGSDAYPAPQDEGKAYGGIVDGIMDILKKHYR